MLLLMVRDCLVLPEEEEWSRPASSWANSAAVCWEDWERAERASEGEAVSSVDNRSDAVIGDMVSGFANCC